MFSRSQLAVRSRPHGVTGLGGDDQFVTIGGEVCGQYFSEGTLGRSGGRAVIVGQIEVGDPEIEGAKHDLPGRFTRVAIAEVMPESQGYSWQEHS